MDLFDILQLIIAVIFIYLLISLVVSELQEQLAAIAQWRARSLKRAIEIMVGENLCGVLYNSNHIFSSFNQSANYNFMLNCKFVKKEIFCIPFPWILMKDTKSVGPSYIEPQVFAESLLALINGYLKAEEKFSPDQPLFPKDDKNVIDKLKSLNTGDQSKIIFDSSFIKRLIDIAHMAKLKKEKPTVEDFCNEISNTFSSIMERTSGVYKRNAKGISFLLGLLVAFAFNVDTFHIVGSLHENPELRQGFDDLANEVVVTHGNCLEAANDDEGEIQKCQEDLEAKTQNLENSTRNLSLPIGWGDEGIGSGISINKFIGFLISAVATAMGAPFWFELLSRVINVRNTLRPLDVAPSATQNNPNNPPASNESNNPPASN